MDAGVRDIDRCRMPGAALGPHPPRGHPPGRPRRLRADPSSSFLAASVWPVGSCMGRPPPPYLFGPLPLPAALYGVLVFPFIWGLTEQMTYNGYLLSRFQVLGHSTTLAIAIVAFAWS